MDRAVSGQKVSIRAEMWNRLVGLAEAAGSLGNSGDSTPARGRHLLVVNRGEETLPRYTAVEIGAADNAADTADEPVLAVTAPSGGDAPFAVLLEPAPKDKVVRAAVSGVARAKAIGAAGAFAGPSADGSITEGGSGAARILVPGDPGVVILNAGAGRSYRPFEAWVNYQPGGGGWTLWFVEGPVFFWGRIVPEGSDDNGILSFNGGSMLPVPFAEGETEWTVSGKLRRTGFDRGSWYLALELAYGEDGATRPVSWSASVIPETDLSEVQARCRPKYIPIAKFKQTGDGPTAAIEFTQLRSGMVVVADTSSRILPDPAFDENNPILVGVLSDVAAAADIPVEDTWNYEAPVAQGNWTAYPHTGIKLHAMTRVAYAADGDKVLYGYFRTFRFSPDGRLVSISGETQTVIDTPVEVSIDG